jgi:predicted amidohydrolase
MSALRVSFVQAALHWEDPSANRALFAERIAPLQGQTDLVILPEMFTTGFSMRASQLAEPMDGPTMQWLRQQAAALDAAIVGSFICAEGKKFHNRLVFVRPDGHEQHYDKRHLFTLAGENQVYSPGKKRLVTEWRGWRICPLVCYDLRFPTWSRNSAGNLLGGFQPPYDLLIYVANWPKPRRQHWRSLLNARAIENQAFTIGVNIVGTDGKGLEYSGDSTIVEHSGQVIFEVSEQESVHTAELSLDALRGYRQQLPFLQDADAYKLL